MRKGWSALNHMLISNPQLSVQMAMVMLGCSFQGLSPKTWQRTRQQFGECTGLGQHLEILWHEREFSITIFLGNVTNYSPPT